MSLQGQLACPRVSYRAGSTVLWWWWWWNVLMIKHLNPLKYVCKNKLEQRNVTSLELDPELLTLILSPSASRACFCCSRHSDAFTTSTSIRVNCCSKSGKWKSVDCSHTRAKSETCNPQNIKSFTARLTSRSSDHYGITVRTNDYR